MPLTSIGFSRNVSVSSECTEVHREWNWTVLWISRMLWLDEYTSFRWSSITSAFNCHKSHHHTWQDDIAKWNLHSSQYHNCPLIIFILTQFTKYKMKYNNCDQICRKGSYSFSKFSTLAIYISSSFKAITFILHITPDNSAMLGVY